MNCIKFSLVPLLLTILGGCYNPSVKQHTIYEIFRLDNNNEIVELKPTDHKYCCKKGDNIIIKLQHIGPDKDLLNWMMSVHNMDTRNDESDYSMPKTIPLSQEFMFKANKIGNFHITLNTFLGEINVPMKTHVELMSLRSEGKIILKVK